MDKKEGTGKGGRERKGAESCKTADPAYVFV